MIRTDELRRLSSYLQENGMSLLAFHTGYIHDNIFTVMVFDSTNVSTPWIVFDWNTQIGCRSHGSYCTNRADAEIEFRKRSEQRLLRGAQRLLRGANISFSPEKEAPAELYRIVYHPRIQAKDAKKLYFVRFTPNGGIDTTTDPELAFRMTKTQANDTIFNATRMVDRKHHNAELEPV